MNNTNSRKSLMIINNIKKQNKTKQNQKKILKNLRNIFRNVLKPNNSR